MYLTAVEFVQMVGAREVAQATACHEPTLQVLTSDGDTSGLDAAHLATAQGALTRIADALERASLRMDSHIRVRYQLPLSSEAVTSNDLGSRAAEIVRFQLWSRPGDDLRRRFDDAIGWLQAVSKGSVALVNAESSAAPGTDGGGLGRVIKGQGKSRFNWSGY